MKRSPEHWSVGVVIPARDEEATIEDCIASVIEAATCSGQLHSLWIVVVADACSDATAEVARRAIGSRGQVLECAARSAGSARALGAAAVIARFGAVDPTRLWLANTDADTRVTRDWLRVQLEYANQGIAAVAGIVTLDPRSIINDTVAEVFRDTYLTDVDGTHSHVHGANLAVRGDTYLDVGGWSSLALAEDHCLWGRIRAKGWQVHSPVSSVVLTSSRLVGRACGGFADTLMACVNRRYERV